MARSALSAAHLQDEEAAFAYVEAALWPHGPVCPHCHETKRIGALNGKTTRPGLRKCYACKKPFTVRQGTIFESSHLPLHLWLQVIHLFAASKKGIATRQIQRLLNCSMKTAWFLGHRIREAMKEDFDIFTPPLGGAGRTLEADEAFIGRDGRKKLAGPGPQLPVVALVERKGHVRSFHVANVNANTIGNILAKHAHPASNLMTDGGTAYRPFGWNFAFHGVVQHKRGEYVSKQDRTIHTNMVEGYFSLIKRGIVGVFHHVSEAHLGRYLSEFDFRQNTRAKLGFTDDMRAELMVMASRGKRLTYQTTGGAR